MMKPNIVPNQFDDADEGSTQHQWLEIATSSRQISYCDQELRDEKKTTQINHDRVPCSCSCFSYERKTKDAASIVSADSNHEENFSHASTVRNGISTQEEDCFRPSSHLQYAQTTDNTRNSSTNNESPLRNKTISLKDVSSSETDDSSLENGNAVLVSSTSCGSSFSAGCCSSFSVPPGITQDDVLCGRGKGANNFIGNRRFRDVVVTYRDVYSKCTRRSEKRKICHKIVEVIRLRGGKFLTKDSKQGSGMNTSMGGWIALDDEKIIVKVSQALREGVAKWNKATQRYKEVKAMKAALIPNVPSDELHGEVARWNKADAKYQEARVKTVAMQSNAPAIALLAEISALQT
mmetsp:Transcript_29939/g.45373  ORF Transcript_29939/g.45373 Transcript_29939/m.45373 type:complete len:349 (-) Transcript_29939:92-1138(-)